jgi:uncharacterized membrane protein
MTATLPTTPAAGVLTDAPTPEAVRHSGSGLGRLWWLAAVFASLVGIGSTIAQIVERIHLAENPSKPLFCDINATLSCGNVLTAWQSSALGIPNATVGLAVFALALGVTGAAALGTRHAHAALWTMQGVITFMLGFLLWFLMQTTFVIGAVCVYCIAIGLSVVVINMVMLRGLYSAGALQGGRVRNALGSAVDAGVDLIVWAGLTFGVAALMTTVFLLN